ncbi:PIN domain-containing protein [Gracilinema caldarium]|nr:PIN domain-containing protein [Gracilinema caldarium]
MNSIVSKIFIDTNILVYTLDKNDKIKNERARAIVQKIIDAHYPVISTQVINEFFIVATKKLNAEPIVVKNIIHNFKNMEIVHTDLQLIEEAIDISIITQLSFWDSLIIAAAEKAHCEFIFSEDLNAGQNYRGVLLLNPFEKEF